MTTATAKKERPILFSGPMVRAILDGKKTQTRRFIKPQPSLKDRNSFTSETMTDAWQSGFVDVECPYGNRGERLWVRETWRCFGGPEYEYQREQKSIIYRATADTVDAVCSQWKPSIFMPRWACRLVLEIEEIRVQRLQEISHDDAVAEGCYRIEPCEAYPSGNAWGRAGYAALWTEINGKRGPKSWAADPFVWVVRFKVHDSSDKRVT